MSTNTSNKKDSEKSNYFSNKKGSSSSSTTSRPGKQRTTIFAMEYYQDKVNFRLNYYTVRNFRDIKSYTRGEKTKMEFKRDQWYKNDNFTFLVKDHYFLTPMYWHRNNLCIYCPELTCLISGDYMGGMYNYMSQVKHTFKGVTLDFKARSEYVPLGGKIEKSLEEGHIYLKEKVDFNVLLSNYKIGYPRAYVLSNPHKVKGKEVWKYDVTSNIAIGIGLDYPLGVLFTEAENYEYLLCPSDVINNLYQFVSRFGVGFKNTKDENTKSKKRDPDEEFSEDEDDKDKGKKKEKEKEKEKEVKEENNEKNETKEEKQEIINDQEEEEFETDEEEEEKEEDKDKDKKIEKKEETTTITNLKTSNIPDNKKSLLDTN